MSTSDVTPTITDQQRTLVERLPFSDRRDVEAAGRGLIASLDPGVVTDDEGRIVWDNDSYAFLQGEAPDSVNPSLWRQSQLVARQGLYEVVPGHLPGARPRPVEHHVHRGRDAASSSSTRSSAPRRPPPRWRSTASTAATGP